MTEPTTPHQRVAERIIAITQSWAKDATLADIRTSFDAFLVGPEPGTIEPTEIANLPATLTRPTHSDTGGMILFCHGGGFQIGSTQSHRSLMCRLAETSQTPVLGVDYRLAPEHRFPAAHEDCFAAYQALIAQGFPPEKIIVAGDSAGGNLALCVAAQARDAGLGVPAAIVLISPWLDMSLRGDSYISRVAQDIFSKPEQLKAMARTYLGRGGDPAHHLMNPLNADLTGLPPIFVHAGDFDITRDDSVLLAQRAEEAGVICSLKIWPKMFHHFQVFAELPEAAKSLEEIGVFIRSTLLRTA